MAILHVKLSYIFPGTLFDFIAGNDSIAAVKLRGA